MVARFQKAEYPRLSMPNRIQELMDKHPDKPTPAQLASTLGITPLTMRRIIAGMDCKLSLAIRIAGLFGKKVTDIWNCK